MKDIRRALLVGFLLWGSLMLLGYLGAVLEDSHSPRWLLTLLDWAANLACFPGICLSRFFVTAARDPYWLFLLQASIYLSSCVLVWSALAWLGLWLWRQRSARS